VQKGTVSVPYWCDVSGMVVVKLERENSRATQARLKKEMAQPRVANSVRVEQLRIESARRRKDARRTVLGMAKKDVASAGKNNTL
jgi:hypothetical protein